MAGAFHKGEAEFDHIEVAKVFLPYQAEPEININFGLVNSVADEIQVLIRRFNLPIDHPKNCSLILIKSCGNIVKMHHDNRIEDYAGQLSNEATTVRLIHEPDANKEAQPSEASLRINLK